MRVLSLFDWCWCAYQALKNLWVEVDEYYASEVDKYAIKIAKKNHYDIIHFWDVKGIRIINWLKSNRFEINSQTQYLSWPIDLLIWWPPCQDLSIAGKRKWLKGERSSLFYEFARVLEEVKPKRFLMENVASMSKENRDIISKRLWVEPIMINSALVTAQNRKRLYRTNIPGVLQPQDLKIFLKDIVESNTEVDREKSYAIDANYQKWGNRSQYKKRWKRQMVIQRMGNINPSWRWQNGEVYWLEGKSPTITTNKWEWIKIVQRGRGFNKGGEHTEKSSTVWSSYRHQNNMLHEWDTIRKLTPWECEALQSFPRWYTEGVSNAQRYRMIWNWFTIFVVQHILSYIPRW